jgi:hypothetical protein
MSTTLQYSLNIGKKPFFPMFDPYDLINDME